MTRMDVFYKIVMFFLGMYKLIYSIGVTCLASPLKKIILQKFSDMGLKVKVGDQVGISSEDYDIHIHDERFFTRLSKDRSLGLGESYMEGWWDAQNLDKVFTKLVAHEIFNFMYWSWDKLAHYLEFRLFNLQTSERAYEVAKTHYDLGNSLFESFLDPSMTYTCAYWKNAKDLEQAQQDKMELIARKLKLKPKMRVLELGCGWGALAKYLAEKYQVNVVGVNIAKEGAKAATDRCRGLPVEIRCCDYREINEKFDRVVAVGLLEHVGSKNYEIFFKVAHNCLKENGIFLCHTIGTGSDTIIKDDPWYSRYIFPNGSLPRPADITKYTNTMFVIEDWHNFGNDYNKTLMAWYKNFVQNWPNIKHLFKDSKKFYRMWTYYLLASAGGFRSRKFQLWQIVLSKNGVLGGYDSVR